MAALKDEWASLMRNRGAGAIEPFKKEEMKSRLLSSFTSILSNTNTQIIAETSHLEVRPEFLALRQKVHNTLQELQAQAQQISHLSGQESAKNYIFGLNAQRARSVSPFKHSPDAKKPASVQIRNFDDIYRLEDTPLKRRETDSLEDRYEIYSIASKKSPIGRHVEDPQREISFLADISPVSRFMANMRADEEEKFYETYNSRPGVDAGGSVHLLEADSDRYFKDRIEFDDVFQFVMGRIPRQKVYAKVGTLNRERIASLDNLKLHEVPIKRRVSEQLLPSNAIVSKPSHVSPEESLEISRDEPVNIPITVPPEIPEEEIDLKFEELLETILSHKKGGLKDEELDKRLQHIMSRIGEEAMKLSHDKQNLKMRLLMQFITEYKKAKEQPQKPHTSKPATSRTKTKPIKRAHPTRPPQVPMEEYIYSLRETPKVSKMKHGWGTGAPPSVLNSIYAPVRRSPAKKTATKDDSKSIGALKYHE